VRPLPLPDLEPRRVRPRLAGGDALSSRGRSGASGRDRPGAGWPRGAAATRGAIHLRGERGSGDKNAKRMSRFGSGEVRRLDFLLRGPEGSTAKPSQPLDSTPAERKVQGSRSNTGGGFAPASRSVRYAQPGAVAAGDVATADLDADDVDGANGFDLLTARKADPRAAAKVCAGDTIPRRRLRCWRGLPETHPPRPSPGPRSAALKSNSASVTNASAASPSVSSPTRRSASATLRLEKPDRLILPTARKHIEPHGHKIPRHSDFGIRRNYSRDQQVPNGSGLVRVWRDGPDAPRLLARVVGSAQAFGSPHGPESCRGR
jgi:hypothetical protein